MHHTVSSFRTIPIGLTIGTVRPVSDITVVLKNYLNHNEKITTSVWVHNLWVFDQGQCNFFIKLN